MKIFTCDQVRQLDSLTIKNEPISSVDLMERAASKVAELLADYSDYHKYIFVGPGNNGGDGLVIARLLSEKREKVTVVVVKISDHFSDDFSVNFKRLKTSANLSVCEINKIDDFPIIPSDAIIVDAIFGSGFSRPATGLAADVIRKINDLGRVVVSVDMPSGLFGEDNGSNTRDTIIKASHTYCFEFPKLSSMFPENADYYGTVHIVPIGLDEEAKRSIDTPYLFLQKDDIFSRIKDRAKFSHKGTYGHALMIGGSYGNMGAVVLGAKAALRTGAGLVSCHVPSCGNDIIQIAVPEAMVSRDDNPEKLTMIPDVDKYSAISVGPGIGTDVSTKKMLESLLRTNKRLVIDADALNIISSDNSLLDLLPSGSILTPHPKEFERLVGKWSDEYQRLQKQIDFSRRYNCFVVLKGANTSISSPDGRVFFNSTGNPGMATAGSGDVLTGIIVSLLAQKYDPFDAAIVGVYLHGMAGDIAASKTSQYSLIASDIIDNIGEAYNTIKK
ncbi:MAG: NAD(P)H-hydrate dehydratase [Bacteroidales bacterium]|nr:NAD(P)H-hydrate dehydratase [Bacteroidales bacterium]